MKYLIMHGSYGSPDKNWFPWLQKELQSQGSEVLSEAFPVDDWGSVEKIGKDRIADYSPVQSLTSWEEFFVSNIYPKIKGDQIAFAGHSIAPIFILHMLEKYDFEISTAIFVAPFFNIPDSDEIWQFYPVNNTFYSYDFDFDKLKQKVHKSFVVYGDDDPYIPSQEPILFAQNLDSKVHLIPGGKHCGSNFSEFPILMELFVKGASELD